MSAPSVIQVLHARYETALKEHETTSNAQPLVAENVREFYVYERALASNSREVDALREALLYQAPTSNEDLTILAYHAWAVFDAGQKLPEREREALAQALTSIFNHHVSEGHADIESGAEFHRCALMALQTCQLRTGQVEA